MSKGKFGKFGGQFISETLMPTIQELEEAYDYFRKDEEFNQELTRLFNEYAGRPSLLYFAENMTNDLKGPKYISSGKI